MGRIKHTSYSEQWVELTKTGCSLGETNDCAVIAISIVTGCSYEKVHREMASQGRRPREGTLLGISQTTIHSLGFRMQEWSDKEMRAIIDQYPQADRCLRHITTYHPRRFSKVWRKLASKRLILVTHRHMLAYRDGHVQDWSINRALRVEQIWEIL